MVGRRGDGPDAEDEEDRSAAVHGGQIGRYDPFDQTITLAWLFAADPGLTFAIRGPWRK